MRGEATIDVGAAFRYPTGKGQYAEATTVTVRAPGLSQFNVHSRMQAFVMDALFSVARKAAQLKGVEQARLDAEADESAEVTMPDAVEFMDQMAIGLSTEAFPEFCAYVKKVLTNSPLATVGDGGRIMDETWDNIEEAGGTDAALKIMGTFALFFVRSRKSKSATGNGSSTTSSSPTKEPSAPSGPKVRPLRN